MKATKYMDGGDAHTVAATQKLQDAFKRIAEWDSKVYRELNGNRDSVSPLVVKYRECILVGSWHLHLVHDEKKWTLIKDAICSAFKAYLDETPEAKRLVMIEGMHNKKGSHDVENTPNFSNLESAMKWGEPMGVLFLSKEENVRVIYPEPDDTDSISYLVAKGFTRDEAILFFIARGLPGIERQKAPSKLVSFVSYLLTGDRDSGTLDRTIVMDKLLRLSTLFEELYGKPLVRMEDGIVHSNITSDEVVDLINPTLPVVNPRNAKLLNYINLELDVLRNEAIIEDIAKATDEGLRPFVIYGRSHIAVIKPAIDYLYGEPLQLSL